MTSLEHYVAQNKNYLCASRVDNARTRWVNFSTAKWTPNLMFPWQGMYTLGEQWMMYWSQLALVHESQFLVSLPQTPYSVTWNSSSKLCIHLLLKINMAGAFTPQKFINATNQGFFSPPKSQLLKFIRILLEYTFSRVERRAGVLSGSKLISV